MSCTFIVALRRFTRKEYVAARREGGDNFFYVPLLQNCHGAEGIRAFT